MTDCLVVGAGIIGICCGLELLKRGKSVLILDENPPGSMTSSGNAGGFGITEVMPIASPGVIRRVPGWLFDPYGPLAIRWSHLPAMTPWLWRFHRQSTTANMTANAQALRDLLAPCMDDTRTLLRQAGLTGILTTGWNGASSRSTASRPKESTGSPSTTSSPICATSTAAGLHRPGVTSGTRSRWPRNWPIFFNRRADR